MILFNLSGVDGYLKALKLSKDVALTKWFRVSRSDRFRMISLPCDERFPKTGKVIDVIVHSAKSVYESLQHMHAQGTVQVANSIVAFTNDGGSIRMTVAELQGPRG